ncbi:hypothetical protein BRD09_05725 [Halobacteriales archaeon SW_10_68_16]|nr:MAG: hypothetical protein BRD09_05725 [Halobacteriales archaeon SW_10_68_16]
MPDLELYELAGCPYCAKVKRKLDELGLDYESHMVPRSHGERTEVKEVSGQTGVPVLVDNDNGVEGMPTRATSFSATATRSGCEATRFSGRRFPSRRSSASSTAT